MPKHDFLTPKAISNRIKSVGLQKLRWYCQMCQKQCRDENGFKCHATSEGHLRQMRLFAENSGRIMDEFSRAFEKGFLDTLSHRHGTKRVLANRVYQEYIGDKHHVHMNSTRWTSLTGLCKHLGKEGKAVVDETEKGWFIQYIDRDPKALARQLQNEERRQSELDEEERSRRMILAQIRAANELKEASGAQEEDEDGDGGAEGKGEKEGEGEGKALYAPVEVSLKIAEPKKRKLISFQLSDEPVSKSAHVGSGPSLGTSSTSSSSGPARSQLEQLMLDEEARKAAQLAADDKRDRRDHWLHPGLVVKVVNKKLADGKYYKKKGVVLGVHDVYVGDVEVEGAVVRLDQEHLETVIPKVGQPVLIVNGRGRGLRAVLVRINEEAFNCDIRVSDPAARDTVYGGRDLTGIEYEDVCKLSEELHE